MEKRLQLLRDIASEFSIKWDSRGFEQRMANPSAFVQARPLVFDFETSYVEKKAYSHIPLRSLSIYFSVINSERTNSHQSLVEEFITV